ncbi:MAG: hypothetical protein ACRDU8_10145, partial [Egibacteraceae bacterium]
MARQMEARTEPQVEQAPARLPLLARLNARGLRLLMVADAVALYTILIAIIWLRVLLGGFLGAPLLNYALGFGLTTVIFMAAYYFGGLYERELRLGQRALLPQVTSLTLGAWLIVSLLQFLLNRNPVPRSMLPLLLVFAIIAVAVNRLIARWLRLRNEGSPRVLLVGAPDDVNLAQSHLKDDDSRAVVVGQAAAPKDLPALVAATRATEVLLLN